MIHPQGDHPEHRKGLQQSETTFVEVLTDAGYVTGIIGKEKLPGTQHFHGAVGDAVTLAFGSGPS